MSCCSPEELTRCVSLDGNGIFPAAGEGPAEFFRRADRIMVEERRFLEQLAAKKAATVFGGLTVRFADRVSSRAVTEAHDMTNRLYGFQVRHVQGFYLSQNLGPLWGGCLATDPLTHFSVYLLRQAFKNRRRWWIYDGNELVAHELCHAARLPLDDPSLEEYFAYQTSRGGLRRYLGNCFIHRRDAVLLLASVLAGLAIQVMNVYQYWTTPPWLWMVVALAFPLYLLIRNHLAFAAVQKACRRLAEYGVAKPLAVAFRCNRREIGRIGRLESRDDLKSWTGGLAATELRWAVIHARFLERGK